MNFAKVTRKWKEPCLVAVLLLLIAAVFGQVIGHDFINYDDDKYITNNEYILGGLNTRSFAWAFRTTYAANWHPLTWISHMLDVELFDSKPWGHHLTSLLLHGASAILLFLALARITGCLWRSWFVAALFAVHPLHVVSVAWAAERKDVLSGLFWMLTIWVYAHYVHLKDSGASSKRTWLAYTAVVVTFALGLMSKPMLVTLPFVLVLLDFWPLRRHIGENQAGSWRRLLVEKIPLFMLSASSCVITFVAQKHGGAVTTIQQFPLSVRLTNAVVSYVTYIWKSIFPARLAVFYPHVGMGIPIWELLLSCGFLAVATWFAVRGASRYPYATVGWFWYLGTLVPVIGIIQVGAQSLADRYTYLPLIGLFVIVAWCLPNFTRVGNASQLSTACTPLMLRLSLMFVVGVLAVCSFVQASYWQDSISLFRRAIATTRGNYLAHNNLAFALAEKGDVRTAIRHYYRALEIKPDFGLAHNNLGLALAEIGEYEEAIKHYKQALAEEPNLPAVYNNLGIALIGLGRFDEAIYWLSKALELQPNYAEAHTNMGIAFLGKGDIDSAIIQYKEALKLRPDHAPTHTNLGVAYARAGNLSAALAEYNEALRLDPNAADAHSNLGLAYSILGKWEEAAQEYREALQIKPSLAQAHRGLAIALASLGDYAGAWEEVKWCLENGVPVEPEFVRALSQKISNRGVAK